MKHLQCLVLGICVTLSGCATIVSKTSKDVTFTSEPSGAKVTIESKKAGRYYSTTTPGTINMSKKASYWASFSCDGYHTVTVPVDREVGKAAAGSSVGNLLLVGIFAPIAIGVDAASGAAASLPENVNCVLVPVSEPVPSNAGDIPCWRAKITEEQKATKKHRADTSAVNRSSP